MKEFPRKWLSLRDKNGARRRSKSPPAGIVTRPLADSFRIVFKTDPTKSKDDADEKIIKQKIKAVQTRLDELGITNIPVDHIRDILLTKHAAGEAEPTVEFIDIEQKASVGVIVPYNPRVKMVGAENRGNVTCYLDSLLFAMFVKLDAFECILKNNFPPSDSRHKLVNLLRIWVNMLRMGKLIRTDLTKLIQESLAECGWSDARELEQQDTSEAFAFLTETLQLPLLSLQVDLFHQGKGDKDDHKVVYERLLNLAVPPDPEGKGIKLEDCLEDYFNTQVDVLRDSEEAKKSTTDDRFLDRRPSLVHRNTLRITTEGGQGSTMVSASPVSVTTPVVGEKKGTSDDDGNKENRDHIMASSITMQRIDPEGPPSAMSETFTSRTQSVGFIDPLERRPSTRHRSASVIQNILVDGSGRPASTDDVHQQQKARRKGSTVIKAVTIPAWQFFRLIPWHAVTSNEPKTDGEVAMNFDQRPVVGICLKRYLMTEDGEPKRHNTYIDIPDSLRLPRFMLADSASDGDEDSAGFDTDYKLVLQSVICHRGDSLQSGHYISFARVAPKLLTDNRRHDFDPPPDYEEAQWLKFDDNELDNRVVYVDNLKQALKREMPYLLFYQVVPMVDTPSSTEDAEPEPPSYDEFRLSVDMASTPTAPQLKTNGLDHDESATPTAPTRQSPPSQSSSIRFSSDLERPRQSLDIVGSPSRAGSSQGGSRRESTNLTGSALPTPARTPDGQQSPLMSPTDESTASRLSRAAARFKGRQSRPVSQYGDNRVSMAVSRMAGLMMRPSKEPLEDPTPLAITTSEPNEQSSADEAPLERATTTTAVEVPTENEPTQLPSRNGSLKNGIKLNGKGKEKASKTKSGGQPERECTVM